MNDDLDALLRDDFLRPPADFTQRVMQRIQQQHKKTQLQPTPLAAAPARPWSSPWTRRWNRLRWLLTTTGLVASGLLGLSQLASFVFGWWLVTAAL
jgi:hypothetical protein